MIRNTDDSVIKPPGQKYVPLTVSTKQQILDSSKLKEFVDNISIIGENSRKFSIRVENTVGKGEIALQHPSRLKGCAMIN